MRFLRVPIVICIGVLGCLNTAPAFACTSDELTLDDGSCVPVQFTMYIAPKSDDEDQFEFQFNFTAYGTMYIDWGDGSKVQEITTNNANKYRNANHIFYGPSTVRLSGDFTEYYKKSSHSASYATLRLYDNDYLVGISGSLGALFPTQGNGSQPQQQPSFYQTFANCSNLKGPIPPELFNGISGTARQFMFTEMFSGCTNLNGYIPYNLFPDSNTLSGVSSSNMNYIFNNDPALATTSTGCPEGTTRVTVGYENFWNNHIACKPDAVACDHPYSGECPDLCPFASELKASNGASIPLFAERVTTHTLCVKKDNTTCYIPLENGIGGTGSLNVKNGNDIYHAGQIDTL